MSRETETAPYEGGAATVLANDPAYTEPRVLLGFDGEGVTKVTVDGEAVFTRGAA